MNTLSNTASIEQKTRHKSRKDRRPNRDEYNWYIFWKFIIQVAFQTAFGNYRRLNLDSKQRSQAWRIGKVFDRLVNLE